MDFLKLFSANERDIKGFRKICEQINALEPSMKPLSNEQLRAKTDEFKERYRTAVDAENLTDEERKQASRDVLNELLPEAFAVVREASIRTLGLRHFDVQMIGGMVLHQGRIAEMRTGEGKTLVATLPLYLNALTSRGAHLVTVNDYLSKRDARWNGPVFHLLGLSVGSIHGQSAERGDTGGSFLYVPDYVPEDANEWEKLKPITRQQAYACDITYGTNHEFGFDYLRDNMAFRGEDLVQRDLHFAIVDEVDSILIDEARTPLIISGQGSRSSDMYYKMDKVVRRLVNERDYTIDEKAKTAMLTEEGTTKVEELTGCGNLSDSENIDINQYVNASLKAHAVFRKDIDYVVKDGQVIIVDEFTGRLMFGRRWSDGLHQAVEAKEGVQVEEESQTLATITYQNFFRLYDKLAGMTGTAKTEEDEFRKIYALDVVEVPTNRAVLRKDMADVVYKSEEAKFRGITIEVLKSHVREQPVLVGTRSIEVSERISERLLSERLQLLAATIVLRDALEKSSEYNGDEKKDAHASLNASFEGLDIYKFGKLAKRLGVELDMTSTANASKLASILEISPSLLPKLEDSLKEGIVHSILNAKFHEMEAEIISQAGRRAAVTIATNMAGRGVDIILGGTELTAEEEEASRKDLAEFDSADLTWDFETWKRNNPDKFENATPEALDVVQRGGLYIIGSERHESRRIDNQLRGRAGRQGDPGFSKFFVSLEDELWRLFGDKSNSFLLGGWQEDQSIDAKILSKMIERAQKKVEMHHFDMRKHVLEYDDVMNVQRETIYSQRRKILEGIDLRATMVGYLLQTMQSGIDMFCADGVHPDEWDTDGLFGYVNEILPLEMLMKPADIKARKREELEDLLGEVVEKTYELKEQEIGPELMRDIERHVALDLINRKWIDHLDAMDYLREGIGLRGYAQRDPIVEYKREAFDLFQTMLTGVQDEMVRVMYRVQTQEPPRRRRMTYDNVVELSGDGPQGMGNGGDAGPMSRPHAAPKSGSSKVGRNDPCPCGSGKKFKKCCLGKIEGSL
jgi:preprotein translocase subunit SecA